MPHVVVRAPEGLLAGFARIRRQLSVPEEFPSAVTAEAEGASPEPGLSERRDATAIPFVTIDPEGSRDLDQALAIERQGDGYRLWYAIADVAAWVTPGGAIDAEARRRGTTLYSPDKRAPLHPPILSEDRASLLPDGDRPALLWTIELDAAANPTTSHLERAVVRSRAALSYHQAQAYIDAAHAGGGSAPAAGDDGLGGGPSLLLLAEIGALRQAREAERGGISLNLPAQAIVEAGGTYRLHFERALPSEGWNAQISLLTGIVAGRTMVEAKVGILRTLPAPHPDAIQRLRHTATALGLDWPAATSYPDFVRALDTTTRQGNAFLLQAAHTLRGAGYVGFDGTVPSHPQHGAIASVYGHVTAPLRRLVDRFGNEILVSLYAGARPPAWATDALDELPTLMAQAQQRESGLERAMLDYAEAVALGPSVGQTFTGVVVDINADRNRAQVQITEPAIVADIPAQLDGSQRSLDLAQEVTLKLTAADPVARTISFEAVGAGHPG